jgi:hypothetical protein
VGAATEYDLDQVELLEMQEQLFATDLSLSVWSSRDPVVVGRTVAMKYTVENLTPVNARGPRVFVQLPKGSSYVSSTAECAETSALGLECDLQHLDGFSSVVFEVVIEIHPGIHAGTRIITSEVAVSAGNDANLDNNAVELELRVAWQASASYQAGDEVVYDDIGYRARQAHTARDGWEPPEVYALWERLRSGNPWAPQVLYEAGAEVSYNGRWYRAIQSHQSQAGWEPPNTTSLWWAELP